MAFVSGLGGARLLGLAPRGVGAWARLAAAARRAPGGARANAARLRSTVAEVDGRRAPRGEKAEEVAETVYEAEEEELPSLADLYAERPPSVPVERQKLLQVAIMGVPNAGKSTLVNHLVGKKVTAVSPKTNTTVHCRLGVFNEGDAQIALYDTPGLVEPHKFRDSKHGTRIRAAWGTAGDCDMLLFILDAHRQINKSDPRLLRLISSLNESKTGSDDWSLPPSVLVLNKLDALKAQDLPKVEKLEREILSLFKFDETFWISALKGRGVPELRSFLVSKATPGEWTLPDDQVTDAPEAELAQEIVREKIFRNCYAEVPYNTQVVTKSLEHLEDGSIRLEQNLFVPSESAKAIVLGAGGKKIKSVGIAAKQDLESLFGTTVHLYMTVKVRK